MSYGTDEGGLQKVAAEAGEGGEIQDTDIISDDEMPQIKGLAKVGLFIFPDGAFLSL